MKISIAADALSDETHWRFLDTIVGKVADGWHVWQIEEPEVIEKSGWLIGRSWLREFFQKAALAAAYPSNSGFPQREIKVSNARKAESLPPQLAAEYVSTPLTVLMENSETDGLFLNTVLDVLAPKELNEQRQQAPDSIYYDSRGGCGEIPKRLEFYVNNAQRKGIPPRVIAFTDSDGNIPGELHNNAQLVKEACESAQIPCLVLSKRTIENYIPDEVFDAWIPNNPSYEKRRIVDAIKQMTPAQRDHYPMKKGFKRSPGKPRIPTLYTGISDSDLAELDKGLGKDVIKILEEFRGVLTPEALLRQDGQDELLRLVELIAAEL